MPLRKGSIGTGPYKVVSNDTPTEFRLERFDQYYLGRPTIAYVEIKSFDTLRTAWTSLLRGDVDFVSDVPADAVEFIRNEDVQVIPYARRYQFMMPFNARRGALRSASVRRALNLAIDREALIRRVLQDAGTPSTGPLWPSYWAYDETVQPYVFDPGQAAALLDDAGYPVRPANGDGPPARFRFVCVFPAGFAVLERMALELQKYLLNVGVDMQLRAVTIKEFNTLIPNGDFDAVLNDQSSGPTPGRAYVYWRSRRNFEGPYNVFGYENAEAERLFTVLNTSMNDAAMRSATSRLQRVMINDPPALFIAWNRRARAIRREFVIPEASEPIGSLWRWTVAPGARRPSRSGE
jgi:peptide/nickel transport system substrate-binding protein